MGTDTVYGWNLGEFFNGVQVQLIRVSSVRSTYLILAMELMHTFDQFIRLETGQDIARLLAVSNFDEDIVHKYAFDYIPWYTRISELLNKTFLIRRTRHQLGESQVLRVRFLQQ